MSADGVLDALGHRFVERYPGEVARALEVLPVEEVAAFLAGSPPAAAAAALERLNPELAKQVLGRLDDTLAAAILPRVDRHRAAAILARLDAEELERRLGLLDRAVAQELRDLVAYPPDSAGHLMDPRVTSLRPQDSVGMALQRLRERTEPVLVDSVYLIDEDGRLVGAISLGDLTIAPEEQLLGELSRRAADPISAISSRAEVLAAFEERGLPTLPVVDFEGRLLGVIRHAGLVEAAQAEASLDVQTMVGASRDERALSPPFFAVRKRLPWLQVNLATAFLAAAVVGIFEGTIARFTALAVLLPVVAGQSGNTGAQALAVTMRGLALREVRSSHWRRVALKETGAAFVNGVAVAVTTCAAVYFWSRSGGLTFVIGTAMVISMTLAGLSGAIIPMVLTALRQDPAQSSSIILTTVTDVVGFMSFLGIAAALASLL